MGKSNSGVSHAFTVKQGNIFGRIGGALGQGLAESIPKEVERKRLSNALQEIGNNPDLNPYQKFSALASAPGSTPQIVESGGRLLQQQQYLDAIKKQYQEQNQPVSSKGSYIPTQEDLSTPVKGEIPTLATPEDTAQSYKSYIPPTEQQERQQAAQNFNTNPARYGYDFENALREQKSITQRNQDIQAAHQKQEETAVKKEETLKKAFDTESDRLGIYPIASTVGGPSNYDPKLYQKFEEKLLNSILPKSEGGEGLTQEQAVKKYSDELQKSYESYKDLSSLSPWSPIEFSRRADTIQKNMAALGPDAQNVMMNKLITDYRVSPMYAAHKAFPIKDMPTLKKSGMKTGTGKFGVTYPKVNYAQLKKEMGNTNSPLSVAYELDQMGQNPTEFLKYLDKNREDLKGWQANQLGRNVNLINLQDFWLKIWE